MTNSTTLELAGYALFAALCAAAILYAPGEIALYMWPALALVIGFGVFVSLLKWRVEGPLFGDLGFIYLGWVMLYGLVPALSFTAGSFSDDHPLFVLLPSPSILSTHLWRHVLFLYTVAVGYLLFRGRTALPRRLEVAQVPGGDGVTISLLGMAIVLLVLLLVTQSAPVESYYDNYTRFDHLPWLVKKIVSACIRFKNGFYVVLLTLMFLNYKRYKHWILPAILLICLHEVTFSYGARISALIVILQALCLYHFTVGRIPLMKVGIAAVAIGGLGTALEVLRSYEFDLDASKAAISEGGVKAAAEFGLAFLPGLQLYMDRAAGALPPVEWPMFFSDFISLFTWGDFTLWNPMEWFARNYYPDAIVAPFTLGPIADSAIWGGEVDLFFRGLVNGAFFAFIVRWFIKHQDKWWGAVIYAYCFATCVLTQKYSVLFHLSPLLKNILPIVLLAALIRRPFSFERPTHSPPAHART